MLNDYDPRPGNEEHLGTAFDVEAPICWASECTGGVNKTMVGNVCVWDTLVDVLTPGSVIDHTSIMDFPLLKEVHELSLAGREAHRLNQMLHPKNDDASTSSDP